MELGEYDVLTEAQFRRQLKTARLGKMIVKDIPAISLPSDLTGIGGEEPYYAFPTPDTLARRGDSRRVKVVARVKQVLDTPTVSPSGQLHSQHGLAQFQDKVNEWAEQKGWLAALSEGKTTLEKFLEENENKKSASKKKDILATKAEEVEVAEAKVTTVVEGVAASQFQEEALPVGKSPKRRLVQDSGGDAAAMAVSPLKRQNSAKFPRKMPTIAL